MSTVITRDESQQRYLVDPVVTSPTATDIKLYIHPSKVPASELQQILQAPLVALDFETRGNDISAPDFKSVGVGLSIGSLSIYVSFKHCTKQQKVKFLSQLSTLPLVGHNVYFDGGVFYREIGIHANWKYCTFGLYKQLSSESQYLKHGLKTAQQEMLGWQETNEIELDQWLVDAGYHKQDCRKTPKDEHWYLKKGTNRYFKPLKGEMHRAPDRILGKYCCLDSYSTFLLFTKVLDPTLLAKRIDSEALIQYHQQDFLSLVEILIEAWASGIPINKEALLEHQKSLTDIIEKAEAEFLSHEKIAPYIQLYNERKVQEYLATEPAKFRKPPKIAPEPSRYKKNGQESKVWQAWDLRRQTILQWESDPQNISKTWITWKEKRSKLATFNLNSSKQLHWLIYEQLQYIPKVFTKENNPALDETALKLMGPEIKALQIYKTAAKELGYIDACLQKLRRDTQGIWRIHAQYRVPGTITGRLAGTGGLNIQQLPKTLGYLSCWKPMDPNKTWIDCDWMALEPNVITELTRDDGMMKVYGPNAVHTDIYLFFGSNVPAFRKQFEEAGYFLDAPTSEGIKNAKKQCKPTRNICKTVVLAKQYRAGVKKIHSTLTLNNISISIEEVAEICKKYDETFKGVKRFSYTLEHEWKENKGWIYNGIGRPITVAEDQLKDLVNRVCQSTGHDIHMKALRIMRQLLQQANIEYTWIIPDFHDQFLLECNKEDADKIISLISGPLYDILNAELDGLIPIKGDPQIVSNLAEAKIE